MLAFGAHPDDVELSAGGTLAKLASQGKRCAIVDLTRGELGTRGSAELRDREAAASASILGLVHRENLGLADGFFEVNEASLRLVVSAIRRLRPSVVLANALEDRHPDHGRGAELVARAAFPCRPSQSCDRFRRRPEPAWRPVRCTTTSRTTTARPTSSWTSRGTSTRSFKAILAFGSQFHDPIPRSPPRRSAAPNSSTT